MVIHPDACTTKNATSRPQIRGFFLSFSCSLSPNIEFNNRSPWCQFETPLGVLGQDNGDEKSGFCRWSSQNRMDSTSPAAQLTPRPKDIHIIFTLLTCTSLEPCT